jgi:3',5'-cyclic AMP phosphodiesterase CpdA
MVALSRRMESARTYALAHFSDPHLTSLRGVAFGDLLNKRLLGYLSWLRRRRHVHRRDVLDVVVRDIAAAQLDFTMLSGDLTHVGLPQECEAARVWLESVAVPAQLLVVPGNHDRYVAAPWQETVGRWSAYVGAEHELWPRVVHRDALAVISLDCAVPSAPGLATGTLGRAQLDRLRTVLEREGAEGRCRVVMLHHSPLPDGHAWRKRLTDAAELRAVLGAGGAELVVHGHGHHEHYQVLEWARASTLVVAAPSASDRGEGRAGWNLYRIARREGGWTISVSFRRLVAGAMTTRSHREFDLIAR